jgi:alkylation response protein AidB-like acyl-CoA dehydrogenase
VVQVQVAQAEATLGAASLYLWRSLEEIEAELAASGRPALSAAQRMRIRLASTTGIHRAKEAADLAYRAAGATAIFESNPFERRYRDLHAVTQQIQGRFSHLETVGQFLLGVTDNPGNY